MKYIIHSVVVPKLYYLVIILSETYYKSIVFVEK